MRVRGAKTHPEVYREVAIFGQYLIIRFIFREILSPLPSIYEDVFAPDLDSIAIPSHRRVLLYLPRSHIILPAVPGTGNDIPLQNPLPERPTPMKAGIVDGIELAPDIGQRDGLAFHMKLTDRSGRDFIDL